MSQNRYPILSSVKVKATTTKNKTKPEYLPMILTYGVAILDPKINLFTNTLLLILKRYI